MNNVLTSDNFPVTVLMRVEDGKPLSLDIFGPPLGDGERRHMERVAKGVRAQIITEFGMVGMGDVMDDVPTNIWLASDGVEFIPGEG